MNDVYFNVLFSLLFIGLYYDFYTQYEKKKNVSEMH
jgi:hypothetical protein